MACLASTPPHDQPPPSPPAPSDVSDEELQTTLRVLRSLLTDEGEVSPEFRQPRLKPLRIVMQR